jgi:hypothetical protein
VIAVAWRTAGHSSTVGTGHTCGAEFASVGGSSAALRCGRRGASRTSTAAPGTNPARDRSTARAASPALRLRANRSAAASRIAGSPADRPGAESRGGDGGVAGAAEEPGCCTDGSASAVGEGGTALVGSIGPGEEIAGGAVGFRARPDHPATATAIAESTSAPAASATSTSARVPGMRYPPTRELVSALVSALCSAQRRRWWLARVPVSARGRALRVDVPDPWTTGDSNPYAFDVQGRRRL